MGYVKEPKNVDLLVAPSVFIEATKQTIELAIASYKKTGEKPGSVKADAQASIKVAGHSGN